MQAKSSITAQIKIQFSVALLTAASILIASAPNAIAQPINASSNQNIQTAKEQITSSTQPELICRIIAGKLVCK